MRYTINRALGLTGVALVAALLLSVALCTAYARGARAGAYWAAMHLQHTVDVCQQHA